jgi:selenocysteine lyase/cysteine desulfurase
LINIERIRADTPATSRLAYLHNAGAALMPVAVVEAMKQHIDLECEIGGYAAADREARRLDSVYGSVARLLNAAPDEIALMENATVAWQMAFYALPFSKGDRILTAEAEYAANYVAFLQVTKRTGAAIDIVPSDASGELDVDALERMIDERVKLIAITWVPTNGGLVNPAAAVGKIARAHGIPYLLDACQAVGQLAADVEAIGCDMLSATGRKFLRGPRGTGFLYVRRATLQALEPPMIDHFAAPWVSRDAYRLRDDARRFETWENNYAARLGLGAAVDYALDIGIGPIERPQIAERPATASGTPAERSRRPVCFDAAAGYVDTGVHWRPDLEPGHVVTGPAVVEEYGSTVPLHPGWTARVDGFGNLVVTAAPAASAA